AVRHRQAPQLRDDRVFRRLLPSAAGEDHFEQRLPDRRVVCCERRYVAAAPHFDFSIVIIGEQPAHRAPRRFVLRERERRENEHAEDRRENFSHFSSPCHCTLSAKSSTTNDVCSVLSSAPTR